jgi:hypothetical protein
MKSNDADLFLQAEYFLQPDTTKSYQIRCSCEIGIVYSYRLLLLVQLCYRVMKSYY